MKIVPVIFEDHNLVRMRPLSWSTPTFELRCGMFNTRERVGLCSEQNGGILLGRSLLRELHSAAGWEWGAESLVRPQWENSRFLFITGMLAPNFSLIRGLLALKPDTPDFVWRNEHGLVAALIDFQQAAQAGGHWATWEKNNASKNVWTDPGQPPTSWSGDSILAGGSAYHLDRGNEILVGPDGAGSVAELQELIGQFAALQDLGPRWIWDIVGFTGEALDRDLVFVKDGRPYQREPFGIIPDPEKPTPEWLHPTTLGSIASRLPGDFVSRLVVDVPDRVFCGEGIDLAPGTAMNTEKGPIILDRGVRVMPQCYLEGPLYIGPGSLVKPGTRIHGESSFGIVNRLAGEIGESTFGDFANKQHDGFIGHAVLGSWINLGAMTTCSDLKNNYGEIRVDLGTGPLSTGQHFVGLMMGDHAKTAIGTLFNTGSCVGFASNIFGAGMPPKYVGNFLWGGQNGCPAYSPDLAQKTASLVMTRRGCHFTAAHGELFTALG